MELAVSANLLSDPVMQAIISSDFVRSREAAEKALDSAYLRYGLEHFGLAGAYLTIGALAFQLGDPAEAEKMLTRANEIADAPDVPHRPYCNCARRSQDFIWRRAARSAIAGSRSRESRG